MANDFRNRFSLLGRPTHPLDPHKHSLLKLTPAGTVPSTDPDLKLIKQYFQILQSIHHTEILEEAITTGIPPLGMARKVAHLTAFIKPAAPDDLVLNKIKENTMEWMIKNLKILIQHYTHTIEKIHTNLGPFNNEALDRALRWAHQRYGRRLTPSSISTLRRLLSAPDPPPPTTPLLLSDPRAFPPLPTRPRPTITPFKHRNTLILPSRPLPIPSLLSLPPLCFNLTRRFPPTPVITPVPQPPRLSRPPLQQRLPVTRPRRPPPVIPPVRTTSAVIDSPCVLETSLGSPTPDPEPPVSILASSIPGPSSLSPAEDTTRRRPCPPSSSPALTSPPPALTSPPPGQTEEPSLPKEKRNIINNGSIQKSELLTICAEIHPCPLTPIDVTLTPVREDLSRQTPSSPSLFSSSMLSTSHHQPCIHPPTNRKATTWSLPIRKTNIIMGDSNLARIPKRIMADIQIDSFPGATLRHLTAVLLKHTSPRPHIKLIVLSIGINNCLREQTAITIIKDTRRLIRTAREKFPQAHIVIPLLTVSIKLSAGQLRCVKAFNDFIRDNIKEVDSRASYLNTLSTLKFHTVHDHIHWTPETAKSMLDDWLTQLDL